MVIEMARPKRAPTLAQHAIADALLTLNPHLSKHAEKERYITLDAIVGTSKRNKNAIGIFVDKVSFMVSNWSSEEQARSRGLETSRSKSYRRLIFIKLTEKIIDQHLDFFRTLTVQAFRESQLLQGYSHFAGNVDDLVLVVDSAIVTADDAEELCSGTALIARAHT